MNRGADGTSAPGPQTLGPYRIVRRVGAGAGGEVFLAEDPGHRRLVALKLMAPVAAASDDGAETERRFVAEALMLRQLQHPDIVQVFDAGHWQSRAWLVMEWLPGHDLSRYTAPARLLPEALVVQLVARLARALAFAHRLGVVHRDVKPGNVRVHLPAAVVKLADFGVARADDATQTRTGVILGTPAYMAPEQLAGAAAEPRSDLYSLGVVLFELLTARRPYEADSMGELLRQVATLQVPDLRQWRPELPAQLAFEVAKALAKDPAARHRDGDQLADALARSVPAGATEAAADAPPAGAPGRVGLHTDADGAAR